MNSSPSRYDRAIDEQAATWAARLDGDVLEASQRAALDAWLAQSPAHRAALSQYCQLSADLEETLPQLVTAGAVAMPAPKRKARILTFPRVTALALATAAAVVLGVWVARPAPPEIHSTAAGQRDSFALSDGTRVELNGHTSLRFENKGDTRVVRLAGGEALFKVAKDKGRPFFVHTPAGSVRVTGTEFNVRTDSAATTFDVTVIEGSVNVTPSIGNSASETIPLVGGEQLSARRGRTSQKKTLSTAALEDELAWRKGWIVFNDTPLAEAAARFAHHHGRSITVDPAIANEPIGARYSLEDFYGFVNAMNETLPVVAKVDANGAATIVPKR